MCLNTDLCNTNNARDEILLRRIIHLVHKTGDPWEGNLYNKTFPKVRVSLGINKDVIVTLYANKED